MFSDLVLGNGVFTMRTMTESEVKDIASPILGKQFASYGFEGVTVEEEEDFDGENILRVIANVRDQVPAKRLIDTLDTIRAALLSQGEGRFVFLSARSQEEDVTDDEEVH